jgi:hypothetical protein
MCTEIPTATWAEVSVGIARETRANKSSPASFLSGMLKSSQHSMALTGCGAAKLVLLNAAWG